MYQVTRLFISGNLEGLTFTEKTTIPMIVGKVYNPSGNQSSYKILECVKVG